MKIQDCESVAEIIKTLNSARELLGCCDIKASVYKRGSDYELVRFTAEITHNIKFKTSCGKGISAKNLQALIYGD
jgi:hypothetical protein